MTHEEKVQEFAQQLRDLCEELKAHAEEVATDYPKCAALCETSAEVLAGLATAHDHYLEKSEKAWE